MDAYRTPAVVEPDPLPHCCVPGGAAPACRAPTLGPALSKVLGGATALFLAAGSAFVAALGWSLVQQAPRDPGPQIVQQQAAVPVVACAAPPPPPHAAPEPVPHTNVPVCVHGRGESALSLLGERGSNDPDVLWTRAELLRMASPSYRLSRAEVPARAMSPAALSGHLQVMRWDKKGTPGLRVDALDAGSPAARAGLRRGDWIAGINGHSLESPYDLVSVWEEVRGAASVVLEIDRQGVPLVLRVDFRR